MFFCLNLFILLLQYGFGFIIISLLRFFITIRLFWFWLNFIPFTFDISINFGTLDKFRLSLWHRVVIFKPKTLVLIDFVFNLIYLLTLIFWFDLLLCHLVFIFIIIQLLLIIF